MPRPAPIAVSRDNPWIAPEPPALATRTGARRVASRAGPTGTLHARAFDRMAARFHEEFGVCAPRTWQGIRDTLAAARSGLVADGTLTESQAARVQEWLERDLEHLAAALVRGARNAAEESRAAAATSPGAYASLLGVLETSGDAVYRAATRARGPALRRVGEVTCAGVVACTQCGRPQRLAASARLDPCRGCQGTVFARGT